MKSLHFISQFPEVLELIKLDLFGRNIDGKVFTDFRGAGLLKKLKMTALLNNIGSYYSYPIKRLFKGAIPPLEKNSYQQKYNFSICYENTKHINGCISERIFDSFASSNVPIYLGAPDIKKWIPENCFIDKRNFKSYKQLYEYIKHMPYAEYRGYIEAIKKFLNSKEINIFRTATYSTKIAEQILKEL